MKRVFVFGLLLVAISGASAAPTLGVHSATNGRIVFQANVKGASQLFTISPDGSGLKQLTHLAIAKDGQGPEQANWSPDGSTIVFDSDYQKTAAHIVSVFTIKPDGSGLAELPIEVGAFTGAPAYSPDAARISFDWDASDKPVHPQGIDVVNADGSNPRRVTKIELKGTYDTRSNWYGRWLVFTRVTPRGDANFKVRLDGTGLKQLTPWAMDANNAKWSPDGSKILFNSWADPKPGKDANIYTIKPDGTGLAQLTRYTGGKQNAYLGGWSPDGTQIVFHLRGPNPSYGANQLFIMNADGSNVRQLTHMPRGSNPSGAAWGTAS